MGNSVLVFACEQDMREFMRNEILAVLREVDKEISDEEVRQGYRQAYDLQPDTYVSDDQVAEYREIILQLTADDPRTVAALNSMVAP